MHELGNFNHCVELGNVTGEVAVDADGVEKEALVSHPHVTNREGFAAPGQGASSLRFVDAEAVHCQKVFHGLSIRRIVGMSIYLVFSVFS